MAWDFSTEPEFQRELDWMDRFVREEIEPIDLVFADPYDPTDLRAREVTAPLKQQVKERGLWACHLAPELGGKGFGQLRLALMNEILGRSSWAPSVFGCQAPDSGNAEILAHYGSEEQKRRFLQPLLDGEIAAADWLRTHTPRFFTPGIIQGDYQFANVMFRHGAPARMAAIVDWEMSTVGDPLLDLAWLLMGWPDPGEPGGRMGYVDYEGMPSRAQLMQRYAERSGLPVDQLDYYVVLARFKMACVLEGGYARYVQGGADNPKMEAFGPIVLDMAARAAELAGASKLPATG